MPLFTNRHVVVTGGAGALGSAVVARLLEGGATCHVPCKEEQELKRFAFAKHERVRVGMDVELTDEPLVEQFYGETAAAARAAGGALWASIHIAGGFSYGAVETVKKDDFIRQMQTNALTCFLCCREAVKLMSSTGGRIVNVAARAAIEPRSGANMVPYTASKAAVGAITQALAEEVVERGILVNAVSPSIMDTPANRKSMAQADYSKWARVEDVASTIEFLASPENTCTRGGLVPVYGRA